jgi:hypothetical protein
MNCANHPDRERAAFCQNCGKPLCAECMRTVGNSVFCEPCFVARGSAAATPPPGYSYPGYVPGQATGYGAAGYPPYPPPGPAAPGQPEPAIAALLGFIPGVGAMYNGQYAKGIVHLVVFAVLCSLANDAGGIFGLFVAGWIFYMVIEAYHTARARRDGTPLPNPFGLNDLGERMGFGRAWPMPGAPYGAGGAQNPAGTQSAEGQNPAGPNPSTSGTVQPNDSSQTYSAPGAYFHRGADGSQTYSTPGAYFHRAADGSQVYGVPAGGVPGAAPWGAPPIPPNPIVPPVPPMPAAYPDPQVPYQRSIPTGAIWLIAIGALFMLGHAPVFRLFHGRLMAPFFLIGLGVWMFVRRMLETGHGLENDGTDYYRWRLANAMHGGMWMVLLGALWLLNSLHLFYWSHSWPVFLIALGVLMIFRRTIFSGGGYGYGYAPPPAAPVPPASAVTSTEIVPVDPTHNATQHESDGHSGDGQEGR